MRPLHIKTQIGQFFKRKFQVKLLCASYLLFIYF